MVCSGWDAWRLRGKPRLISQPPVQQKVLQPDQRRPAGCKNRGLSDSVQAVQNPEQLIKAPFSCWRPARRIGRLGPGSRAGPLLRRRLRPTTKAQSKRCRSSRESFAWRRMLFSNPGPIVSPAWMGTTVVLPSG